MQVTIKDIRHPIFVDRISETSKMVVVEGINFARPIKIVVGMVCRQLNNRLAIRTPSRSIYEADLVIGVDILCQNFSVIKNTYSDTKGTLGSDDFLNTTLWFLCHELLGNFKHIHSEYENTLVMAEIIRVISIITGETIYCINGRWKTTRDIYLDKTNFIRYKNLKHSFVNA